MFRAARLLTALLALTLFAANSPSAITAASVEKPASGLFGLLEQRVGIDALASSGRVDEKLSLLYDFASDFPVAVRRLGLANKSSRQLNLMLGNEQRELLRQFLGTGLPGAQTRAAGFEIPAGLSKDSLEIYGEIARRAIAEGIDRSGVQAARLDLIEKALKALQ